MFPERTNLYRVHPSFWRLSAKNISQNQAIRQRNRTNLLTARQSRPSTHHYNCGQVLRILKTCIKALSMQWHNGPRGWVLFLFWVFQLKINVSELTFGFRGSIWFGLVGFVWLILFRRFNLVSLVCSVSQIIGGSVTDKGGKRQSY